MRTATSVTLGAVLAWCVLAIWHGPTAWLFTRIEPGTPTDHVDRIRIWHHSVEVEPVWPTSSTTC